MVVTIEQMEQVNQIASQSGVFLGFLGGVVKAITSAKGTFDAIGKMVVGSIVAWVSAPFAQSHFPQEVLPIMVFLFGYGGTELVNFIQGLAQKILAGKIELLLNKITTKGDNK